MLRPLLALAFLFLTVRPAEAAAPPLTLKDLSLMARSGYSEEEILNEAKKRRLGVTIDEATAKTLLDNGMPAALIEKLKTSNFPGPAADPAAAQNAARQRAAMLEREQAESMLAERRRHEAASLASREAAHGNIMRMLEGKLLTLQGSELRPFASSALKDVRLFAFFYSCNWTPDCRKANSGVVEWYRRIKPLHPEFELIFVSRDRSEITLAECVRKYAMPFPALHFDAVNSANIQRLGGGAIPWLSGVSRAGIVVSGSPESGQRPSLGEALAGLDFLLEAMKKPGARLKGE